MTLRNFIYSLLLLFSTNLFAQFGFNDYKYVVVPYQFNFLDENDKFRLNTLLRQLFKEDGFSAYFDKEDLPEDLLANKCLAMYSEVLKLKGGFKTEVKIILKDCNNNIILETQSGTTKEKDFAKAYNIAIREAFETIKFMEYSYSGELPENTSSLSNAHLDQSRSNNSEAEIESLKRELDSLKQITASNSASQVVESSEETVETLFAQPIKGGFQLINMEPKKVMVLLKTDTKDVFKVEGKKAIVFKKGKKWIYAETTNSRTKEKELNIKF